MDSVNAMDAVSPMPSDLTSHGIDPWRDLALGELEAERARLEAEIASAKSRTAAARHRMAERDAEVRAALRAELLASKETVTELERHHQTELAAIEERAHAEVVRINAESRRVAVTGGAAPNERGEVSGVE